MTTGPFRRRKTYYFLGSNACGGYEYTGDCDYVLITITAEVAHRLLARIRACEMLQQRFPELYRLTEFDLSPLILSIQTVLDADIEGEEEWQLLTARQAKRLQRLARCRPEAPRADMLSANYCAEEVYWSMFVEYTNSEIDTPTIARASLEFFAGIS